MNIPRTLLHRADGHDRQLLMRLALGHHGRRSWRRMWTIITHLGGAPAAIALALAPFAVPGLSDVGSTALLLLITSHAIVQMVKRTVSRPRPSVRIDGISLALDPDRFSFPSGHSAAAMAVAIAYAQAFPALATPLLAIGALVGASRVMLGVHYPGDVLCGQLLTALTALVLGWAL
jgi:undecaprenyl-diphosphatase